MATQNCIECKCGCLTAHAMSGDLWGECRYEKPGKSILVSEMVRGDGRIIAPAWCPWVETGD